MKVRELEALLRKNGWQEPRRKATSHRVWKKGSERLVIHGNPSREAQKGLENQVLKALGLK